MGCRGLILSSFYNAVEMKKEKRGSWGVLFSSDYLKWGSVGGRLVCGVCGRFLIGELKVSSHLC
jgi:hypothetical protein